MRIKFPISKLQSSLEQPVDGGEDGQLGATEVERALSPQSWNTSNLRVKMIILVVRMVKMVQIMMRAMTRLTLDQLLHTSIADARSLKGSMARI